MGGWDAKVAARRQSGKNHTKLSLLTEVKDTYFGNRYVHAMLLSIRARGWGQNIMFNFNLIGGIDYDEGK